MPNVKLSPDHLSTIRRNTNWQELFARLQLTKDPKRSKSHDWWGKSPFHPDERTPSFHMNDRGWYCHATHQGGGPIELVQRLHSLNCYEAAHWLLEHGVSTIVSDLRGEVAALPEAAEPAVPVTENLPIRQDLRSQLDPDHPSCSARGIPPTILRDLGVGYLDRPPRKSGRPDPLNRRVVFQIRGLQEGGRGTFQPVILSHLGRATTKEQIESSGKWWFYPGFKKSLELYNLDRVILDDRAFEQAKATEHVLVVEGPFDVAKLAAAGIHNVVATFGSHLSPGQLRRLDLIDELIGVNRFRFFYDRDSAGRDGAGAAIATVVSSGLRLRADAFDWSQAWSSPRRGEVSIPSEITDPAEFSVLQLRWLREQALI